jgi:hypothetical protein
MIEDKYQQLREKYNHLFAEYFWGFEVPAAWLYAIEKYLEKTQWDWEKNGLRVQICQIKEKFGTLRIYTDILEGSSRAGLDDENIAYCEAIVNHTCSKCGCMTKDIRYTSGWIAGYCPECFPTKEKTD